MRNNLSNRKRNRLEGFDYSNDGSYFVTICADKMKKFFGDIKNGKMILSSIGEITEKCWLEIPEHFPNVELDKFIVMPNHIHGIILIDNSVGNKDFCSNKTNSVENKDFCSNQTSIVGNKDFCSLQDEMWQKKWSRSLSSIVRGFKIGVTSWCRQNGYNDFCWQKSFYDHIIRTEESLIKIRDYVDNNPLKWELDKNSEENLFM